MTKILTVHLGNRSYSVVVGRALLERVGNFLKPLGLGKQILVVSNKRVAGYFLKTIARSLARAGFQASAHLLPYGDERDKSGLALMKLWDTMSQAGLERTSAVLALGGGVVGDAAGFAASTYLRGISLIHVPTTLLAQVDSSIGGKTAIDLPRAKNSVGTFYQPRIVISDLEALKSLSLQDFHNSFAEVIKYGVVRDPELFNLLEDRADSFFSSIQRGKLNDEALSFLEDVVWRCARIKAEVVERDERETQGERIILNYGHTFAHALEAVSGYRLPHGVAVAIGMALAGKLAVRLKMFNPEDQIRQLNLIRRSGLSIRIPKGRTFSGARLFDFMKRDKKVKHGRLRFILPRGIGRVEARDRISEAEVKKLFNE